MINKGTLMVLGAFIALLSGCGQSVPALKPPTAQPPGSVPPVLTVNAGAGAGTYKNGDMAFIFANPPGSTQVFDRWTGDTAGLVSPNEWRTSLTVPASNVTLTATYKMVAAINFTNLSINGSQVYYFVPSAYRGIVLPFHGATGSASGWVTGQLENQNFVRYAAANGYAVVVTESKDRVNKVWDASGPNSVDIANIDTILGSLQSSGIIAPGKPLYGVGMSQGSGFLSLISSVKGYKAAALYCLGGIDQVFNTSTVPTIWNMAQQDITEDPNRLVTAQANYNKLQARGIPSVYYVNQPAPLYPTRFTIIPGINANGSTAIYNALKSAGYVDAKGCYLTLDPRVSQAWYSSVPAPYNTPAYIPGIEDQLYVAFTQHKFYKDSNFRTIDFFNTF